MGSGLVKNKNSATHSPGLERAFQRLAGTAVPTAPPGLRRGSGQAALTPDLCLTPPLSTVSARGGRYIHL